MRSVKRGPAKTAKTAHVGIEVKQRPNIGGEVLVIHHYNNRVLQQNLFHVFSSKARERKPKPMPLFHQMWNKLAEIENASKFLR
jgi:hypothetical protein